MTDTRKPKAFTGRHMTAILVGFFAVVIAVNLTMARFAMSTFGGKVVENSYVASQHYNEWLKRADAQDRLGWNESITLDAGRHVLLTIRKDGALLDGVQASATINHPVGRIAPAALRFEPAAGGVLRSVEPLAIGRWRLDLIVRHGADEARYREDLQ
ncbi:MULTISPECIES: FixH family protein [unclassified Sphingopyxis]|uniref:FixH family protein n=1 Tax=unclassified Sphingopyxis TaxID=2614943 RepID=UPI0028666D02|nr:MULTISPECIES: FixH family protein [unclassified Sphingopyxis]MDR7060595.1 nitrogen fixation protein FixH [Sphingopyxis sp. BE235]MDR7179892.1 nitrogen fixation protein FixH [Sphingopyxis sp. BE249]